MRIAEDNIGSQMLFEIIQVGMKWLHYLNNRMIQVAKCIYCFTRMWNVICSLLRIDWAALATFPNRSCARFAWSSSRARQAARSLTWAAIITSIRFVSTRTSSTWRPRSTRRSEKPNSTKSNGKNEVTQQHAITSQRKQIFSTNLVEFFYVDIGWLCWKGSCVRCVERPWIAII